MRILEISPVFPPSVGGVRKDVRRALKYFISMLLGMIYGMADYLTGRRSFVWKEFRV